MRLNSKEKTLEIVLLLIVLFGAAPGAARDPHGGTAAGEQHNSGSAAPQQIRIPNRPSRPLFEGKQGKQRSEIYYDPTTQMVTIKLLVQDPNGYFIPKLRRDDFAVYENGVRQRNITVEIEHAAVSLSLLMEFGGHAQALNRIMAIEIAEAGSQLMDVIGREDKIAIWKYSDKVEQLADFSQGHEVLDRLFEEFGTPEFSETNFYDAVIAMIRQIKSVKGRKAIIPISSGIDTFSKANYEEALEAACSSDTPIYVIGLTRVLHELVGAQEDTGAFANIDWGKVEKQLQGISTASGGRAYFPATTGDLSAIDDDMMENLRVRYVITYRSPGNFDLNSPRTVRVELIDPKTGGPLEIIDQNGRRVSAHVVVQDSYVPASASQ